MLGVVEAPQQPSQRRDGRQFDTECRRACPVAGGLRRDAEPGAGLRLGEAGDDEVVQFPARRRASLPQSDQEIEQGFGILRGLCIHQCFGGEPGGHAFGARHGGARCDEGIAGGLPGRCREGSAHGAAAEAHAPAAFPGELENQVQSGGRVVGERLQFVARVAVDGQAQPGAEALLEDAHGLGHDVGTAAAVHLVGGHHEHGGSFHRVCKPDHEVIRPRGLMQWRSSLRA